MHRVFAHIEPVSNTLVNPYAVKASRSCRSSSVGGIASASAHIRSKKWTWLFQRPAVTAQPEQSIR